MPVTPHVTIVIPTCNRREYLGETLDSVNAQRVQDFALYISDNGSTDGTEELVRSRRDPRITYHRFPSNVGIVRNWQQVLTGHATEFVALMNDDDLWLPDHLETGLAALRAEPEAVLYCCATESFGAREGQRYTALFAADPVHPTIIDTRVRFTPMLRGIPALPITMIFRRAALEQLRFPRTRTLGAIDWFVSAQAALYGKTIYDPAIRARYRLHAANCSAAWCTGRRGVVQSRYILRTLAEMALRRGALTYHELVDEVSTLWNAKHASTLVVALTACDTHPLLRRAAFAILRRRRLDILATPDASRHCRAAARFGPWLLAGADVADRLPARWWPCPLT